MSDYTKRPTLKTVAAHCGVSLISVSRVMRNAPNISDSLRQKVIKSAQELGYVPNPIAGSLRGNTSDLVAVIVPSVSNNVFAQVVDGISDALSGSKYRTVLGLSHYSLAEEEAVLRDILAWSPAGIIISGIEHSAASQDMLSSAVCPIVEVMDTDGEPIDVSVGISHQTAGRLMADHLVDQGYKNIGYIGAWGERDKRSSKRRLAFEDQLTKRGLTLTSRHVAEQPSSFRVGAQACQTFVSANPTIDAIFFANDDLAFGAIFHCLEHGISIPNDLAIAGFNGLEMRDGIHPKLTTIQTPRFEIGKRAGKLVRDRIDRSVTGFETKVDLQVNLLLGETT